jgi:hypothetical protein
MIHANNQWYEAARVLLGAYAAQHGPLTVTRTAYRMAPEQLGRQYVDSARYDAVDDCYTVDGASLGERMRTGHAVGVLLLMAARHAMKERDHANAFGWADACASLAPALDPVRAEVTGQEVAQSLVSERRPFLPSSYQEEMERGVWALLPAMRPQGRMLTENMLRLHTEIDAMREE